MVSITESKNQAAGSNELVSGAAALPNLGLADLAQVIIPSPGMILTQAVVGPTARAIAAEFRKGEESGPKSDAARPDLDQEGIRIARDTYRLGERNEFQVNESLHGRLEKIVPIPNGLILVFNDGEVVFRDASLRAGMPSAEAQKSEWAKN